MPHTANKNDNAIKRALALVTEAMDLLDAYGGAPDAAANLSLAQERLRELVGSAQRDA